MAFFVDTSTFENVILYPVALPNSMPSPSKETINQLYSSCRSGKGKRPRKKRKLLPFSFSHHPCCRISLSFIRIKKTVSLVRYSFYYCCLLQQHPQIVLIFFVWSRGAIKWLTNCPQKAAVVKATN